MVQIIPKDIVGENFIYYYENNCIYGLKFIVCADDKVLKRHNNGKKYIFNKKSYSVKKQLKQNNLKLQIPVWADEDYKRINQWRKIKLGYWIFNTGFFDNPQKDEMVVLVGAKTKDIVFYDGNNISVSSFFIPKNFEDIIDKIKMGEHFSRKYGKEEIKQWTAKAINIIHKRKEVQNGIR